MKNPFKLTSSELAGMAVLIAAVTGACLTKMCRDQRAEISAVKAEAVYDSVTSLINTSDITPVKAPATEPRPKRRLRNNRSKTRQQQCTERDYIDELVNQPQDTLQRTAH